MMRIEVFPNPDSASRRAAARLHQLWQANPDLLLCAATGDSPTLTYRFFVNGFKSNTSGAPLPRLLKLDEWGGLALDDPATCEQYLREHLIGPLHLPAHRYLGFHSAPARPEAECQRIASWLQKNGPIDVCVLGLGRNGHLAMNEPGADPHAGCHVAQLTESTLSHPMLGTARSRPAYGLTVGLAEILAAREIILLVFGQAKAVPLARLFASEVARDFPASWLWRHPNVICLADADAVAAISVERLESLGAEIRQPSNPIHYEPTQS